MTFQPDGLATVGAIRINAVADYVTALRGRRTASEYRTANQVSYRCTLAANNTTAMCATSMDIQCHDLLFTLVGKRPRGPSSATLAVPLQSDSMQVMSVLTGHVPSQFSLHGSEVSPLEFRAAIAGSLRFAGVATRDVSLSTDGSLGKSSTHLAVNTSGLVTIFANECVMTGQEVLVDLPFPSSYYHSLKSEDNRYDEKWKEWRDKAAASVCASPGKPFRDTLRVMAASDDNLRATVPRKNDFDFLGDGCKPPERARNKAFGGPWIIGRCVRGNMQAGQKIDVCLYDAPRVAHCCDDDDDDGGHHHRHHGGGGGGGSGGGEEENGPNLKELCPVLWHAAYEPPSKDIDDKDLEKGKAYFRDFLEKDEVDKCSDIDELSALVAKYTLAEETAWNNETKAAIQSRKAQANALSDAYIRKYRITTSGGRPNLTWVDGDGNCLYYAIVATYYSRGNNSANKWTGHTSEDGFFYDEEQFLSSTVLTGGLKLRSQLAEAVENDSNDVWTKFEEAAKLKAPLMFSGGDEGDWAQQNVVERLMNPAVYNGDELDVLLVQYFLRHVGFSPENDKDGPSTPKFDIDCITYSCVDNGDGAPAWHCDHYPQLESAATRRTERLCSGEFTLIGSFHTTAVKEHKCGRGHWWPVTSWGPSS